VIRVLLLAAIVSMQTAAAAGGPWPSVRLTPPVADVAGLTPHTINLDGEWLFLPETPVPYRGNVGDPANWKRVTLPGHYALQGYPERLKKAGESVAYGKLVDIPAKWRDHVIVLRFGSLDGLSRLWVNGVPVGSSDSAFMPVEFDITDQIRPGEKNGIAVTVEWSPLTHWFEREMGGIGRSITLMALPRTHISRLHVDSTWQPGGHGLAKALVTVDHRADVAQPFSLRLRVMDGNAAALVTEETRELMLAPGRNEHVIELPVMHALPWSHEKPALYILQVDLVRDRKSFMTAHRRFGFRSIEIDGPRLKFNGQTLKLQGANYHLTHQGYGHFPPKELIRRDIELMRDMNLTILRSWPTPYEDYLEACDELGMFTTVEVPMNLMIYAAGPRKDHGNDPSLEPGVALLAARMLEAFRSHPSVLLWGVANESPYYPYFQRAAEGIRESDASRPVFFGSDNRIGIGIPGVQVNDDHYPRDGRTSYADLGAIKGPGWEIPGDRPIIFSEWCHVNVNNTAELEFDAGIDDHWGYMAEAHRRWADATPQVLAGFIFKAAPFRGVGNTHPWRGLFEDDRRANAYTWHTFKSCSPLRLGPGSTSIDVQGGQTRFELESHLMFTSLEETSWIWSRGGETGTVNVSGLPGQRASVTIPVTPNTEAPLRVRAYSPRGFLLNTFEFKVASPRSDSLPFPAPEVSETADSYQIKLGNVTFILDRKLGQISAQDESGVCLMEGGPFLVARPCQTQARKKLERGIANLAANWRPQSVDRLLNAPATFNIAGEYDGFSGQFGVRFDKHGVHIAYDFTATLGEESLDMFMTGIGFDLPSRLDMLKWERDALWTDYPDEHPGRPKGTASARGDRLRDYGNGTTQPALPWSQEIVRGATRDFCSTRMHFRRAGLFDDSEEGVEVVSSGKQHLFAFPRDPNELSAGFSLYVLDHYNGGSELHMRKSLRMDPLQIQSGSRLRGGAALRLLSRTD